MRNSLAPRRPMLRTEPHGMSHILPFSASRYLWSDWGAKQKTAFKVFRDISKKVGAIVSQARPPSTRENCD